ncbi:MAG: (deoxy)nucleoside triphosphate pyrophosphohydrolase [Lachnospiraceae bacterium]|nr:(deoxy)nucleoside triphosphate pyrophosphohydrolase [Lachnospiraceae bacterium]
MEEKKTIRVTAAVIHEDGRIFATQRGYGDYKDWWEFPGGKIEPGESPEECVVREIREELSATVAVERKLCTVEWDYPKFHLSMDCFLCRVAEGELRLLEHEAARWLSRDETDSVHWLPSDVEVLEKLKEDWP